MTRVFLVFSSVFVFLFLVFICLLLICLFVRGDARFRRLPVRSFVWFLNVTFYGLLIKTHRPTHAHAASPRRHSHGHSQP